MRFSSRTILKMAAVLSVTSFLNACTKDEELIEADTSEPVEAAATGDEEAAVPPPAAVPDAAPEAAVPAAPAAAIDGTGASAPVPIPTGSTTRRVLYVKANGTPIRAAADSHAKIIGKLDKGDHILVNIEGAWARTDQGGFVAMKGLSEKGVGRSKGPVKWKGGHQAAPRAAKKAVVKSSKPVAVPSPAPAGAPSPAAAPAATQVKPETSNPDAGSESAPSEADGESTAE